MTYDIRNFYIVAALIVVYLSQTQSQIPLLDASTDVTSVHPELSPNLFYSYTTLEIVSWLQ